MTGRRTLVMAMAAGLAAFGCADVEEDEVRIDQPALDETGPAAEEPPMDVDIEGPAIQLDSLEGVGEYLTDARGRALYLLEEEPQDSSICYDECAEEWPPFLVGQGSPVADAGAVREDLISTITRADGQRQVTYAGHPLYYYHDDEGEGDTAGQDLTDQWGEWYLVRPDGEPLEAEGAGESG